MKCRICQEYFFRGTSTLPFNDICANCHEIYVKVKKIPRSKEEDINDYKEIIHFAESRIKDAEQTIQAEQDLIIWAKQQIKEIEK